jgi:hypothetical protein
MVTFIAELVSTDMALEGPLASMAPVVVLQLAARLETLLAYIAHKPVTGQSQQWYFLAAIVRETASGPLVTWLLLCGA